MTPNIKWRLRRGVLELDHILMHFYHTEYDNLSEQDKHDFSCLLEYSDPELMSWLLYKADISNHPYESLIKKIKLSLSTFNKKSD